MNLGMILNANYPSDMRVKKESDALIKAGFNVYLLCLRKEDETYEETINGLQVTRLDAGKNNNHLALWDAVMAISFIHPKFKAILPDWIQRNNISVIHVHDLPLAGTALAIRKKHKVKVVVDLHENYPEALRTWFEWKKGLAVKIKNKLFMSPSRWERHESTAVLESDHVIAVVEEMKQRLIEKYHVDGNKIMIVSNTEEMSFLNQPIDPSVYDNFKIKFRIVYSGGIGPHRGVDTAISAMQYLKPYPRIQLIIIGSGSVDVMEHLNKLRNTLNVSGTVHFLGHQSFLKFYSFMHLADVNIIPHKSNEHTDNTIPHKLFQSMMSGKPLLVSSSDPLKRVVEACRSGLVFDAGDPRDLADKILTLYNDPGLCDQLGKNGKIATVDGDLNWNHEQIALIDFYKRVFDSHSQ